MNYAISFAVVDTDWDLQIRGIEFFHDILSVIRVADAAGIYMSTEDIKWALARFFMAFLWTSWLLEFFLFGMALGPPFNLGAVLMLIPNGRSRDSGANMPSRAIENAAGCHDVLNLLVPSNLRRKGL